MKRSLYCNCIVSIILLFSLSICNTGCKKTDNPIKFPNGTFPDSVYNLASINSAFDDYNLSLYQLGGTLQMIFSSNRKSNGNQFDLEQATISYTFDQTNGVFSYSASMTTDPFLDKLINKAKTPGNDFGPYRFYSSLDGFEYLLLASTTGTDADFVVKLIDVYPDINTASLKMSGFQLPVAMEIIRGRFRKSFEKPSPLIPGKIEEFIIDLHNINHTFLKGHHLMIQVQSSWFPIIDRNPQKFVNNIFEAKESDFIKATETIYCNQQYSSYIELPIMNE